MQDLNLGVIGNCTLGALIDRRGRYVWCCYPRLDGDPIFCNLLRDAGGDGLFGVEIERLTSSHQYYLGNSAILITELTDEAGATLRITDFAPRFKHYERLARPAVLIRQIEPVAGTCLVRIRTRPRFGYGSIEPSPVLGSNHLSFVLFPPISRSVSPPTPRSPIWRRRSRSPCKHRFISSSVPTRPQRKREYRDQTEAYWHEWCRFLSIPFEWQEAVLRAAITLKLCSFEETGAIVSALTTSIPEAPQSGRNWDYRYCWLRDAYLVVHALNQLGATQTMEHYLRFITDVSALEPGGRLKPLYSIVPGQTPLEEQVLDGLKGYRGMGPVRIGNAAIHQAQHDCYGSVIMAAAQIVLRPAHTAPGRRGGTSFTVCTLWYIDAFALSPKS